MGAKWQRLRIDLPEAYTPIERVAIAQEIIDAITERTLAGKNKKGATFPGYTKEYVNSPAFKAAGKGKNVNLRLSGDMLASLKILNESKGSVLIGFENGTEENAKADGNIRGTYGSASPKSGKARDFLGIKPEEKKRILERFPLRKRETSLLEAEKIVAAGEQASTFLEED
jgi:hypothetical protein